MATKKLSELTKQELITVLSGRGGLRGNEANDLWDMSAGEIRDLYGDLLRKLAAPKKNRSIKAVVAAAAQRTARDAPPKPEKAQPVFVLVSGGWGWFAAAGPLTPAAKQKVEDVHKRAGHSPSMKAVQWFKSRDALQKVIDADPNKYNEDDGHLQEFTVTDDPHVLTMLGVED